ncbi:MAG: murein biosynthesis integral membrane protein MurJ [Desulfarculales bacterium]|nr:murein biosynthesis integral membrane protein MurJ [Desulfarculales bacterium]
MVKAASVVGAATFLSRICGFIRDIIIAYLFGAGPAADAFFVAFRVPNLLRRLFAEGALTIAFIPIFTESLLREGREKACELARSVSGALSLVLLLICALGMIFTGAVLAVIAPGFIPGSSVYELSLLLARVCFPFIFFISLAALSSGILNTQEHFISPAISPVLLNLSLICCALGLDLDPPVLSLGVGVLLGGGAQLLIQIPFLKARGMSILPRFKFKNPYLKQIITLMLPAAFGAAVYQITVVLNTVLASFLPGGSVSYLYYADRMVEFPLGIFAVALATAVLPSLSRQAVSHQKEEFIATLNYALRLTMFICLPAMAGLLLLAEPLIAVLFARGEFDWPAVEATTRALWGYGAGLWAFAALRAILPAFYALKDTKTPVKVGAVILLLNLGVGLGLMHVWQHVGLALATSISSSANLIILLWILNRKLGSLGLAKILRSLFFITVACLFMALGVRTGLEILGQYHDWQNGGRMISACWLGLLIVTGAGLYLIAARLFKIDELRELGRMLKHRSGE